MTSLKRIPLWVPRNLHPVTLGSPLMDDGSLQVYIVLGTTGNVYYPTFSRAKAPTCTCRDNRVRRVPCKHILFVLHRVLKLPRSADHRDIDGMLAQRNRDDIKKVLAPDAVREGYLEQTGFSLDDEPSLGPQRQRVAEGGPRPLDRGEDCPICYEDMSSDPPGQLVWCTACRRSMHVDCFGKWRDVKLKGHEPVTCVYCRQPWHASIGSAPFKRKPMNLEEYLRE